MVIKNLADTGEKRILLRRILIYSALFFLFGIAQCSFFSRLKPFGATPNITLGAICGVIMLDNKRSAAICAIAAGYFIDTLGAVPPSFSPLFYLLCVAILGKVSDKMMPRFVSFAALLLPAVVLNAVYTYLGAWLAAKAAPSLSVFPSVILPEILSTFIFCLPIYFLVKLCVIPIGAKGHISL